MEIDLTASLDDLLRCADERHGVEFVPFKIGDLQLELPQIQDMDSYVDKLIEGLENAGDQPPSLELPFWAKIWRTSMLMAFYVQRLSPENGKSLLEIGSGIGLCGLAAAAKGFQVTISDNNADALLFARIAALKNNLGENVTVRKVDFTKDRLDERYDYILGAEILYQEKTYRSLLKFLKAHIRKGPESEIIVGKEYSRKAKKFLNLAKRDFSVHSQSIGFKSSDQNQDGEKHLTELYRLRAL